MFVVGSILAEIEWKNLFEKKVLLYCAIRLIIYPFLVFIALTFLNAPTLIKAIAVIMTGDVYKRQCMDNDDGCYYSNWIMYC